MKKVTMIFIILAGSYIIGCYGALDGMNYYARTEESNHEYTFPSKPYARVEVITENGEISSSSHQRDSIEIDLRLWATGMDEDDAREHIDDIQLAITEDTVLAKLSIVIEIPATTLRGYGCDVDLYLPEGVFVDLNTTNGNIDATGHQAGIDVHTSNEQIKITNTAGDADLNTSNGNINVERHAGNIRGGTSNGDVDAQVVMPKSDGFCEFISSNGKVTLAVPDTVGATLTLKTSMGKIIVDPQLPVQVDSDPSEDSYQSFMGDGSGTIYLKSSNGDVSLNKLGN